MTLVLLCLVFSACDEGRESPPEDAPSGIARTTGPAPDTSAGDAAVWFLHQDAQLTPDSTTLPVDVARLGCNGGVTGEVLEPHVVYGDTQVALMFRVGPHSDGGTCPSNKRVRYDVTLAEPLGERALIDGQCLPTGEARSTSHCLPDAIRWKP